MNAVRAALAGSRERRLAQQIIDIAKGSELGPGGRLPTERQLASELNVSRSDIRNALALLEAEGLISREVGRGTFLAADSAGTAPSAGLVTRADFAPADVMLVRRLLEPQAMPLVVAWATTAELDEMERCVAGGDAAASFAEYETWDMALHRAMMAATRSDLLVSLYQVVEAARHGQMWGDLKRRSASRHRRQEAQAEHRAILTALRARDGKLATGAMRIHIDHVTERLLGNSEAAQRYGVPETS